jgi:hypothetical protein
VDIVKFVAEKLGIEESQARGALGLLLKLAKSKLGDEKFAQLVQFVPGSDEIIAAAPDTSGGIMGAIGGLASAVGAGDSAGQLAEMSGGLSKLGLKTEDAPGLIQAVGDFFGQSGNEEAQALIQEAVN